MMNESKKQLQSFEEIFQNPSTQLQSIIAKTKVLQKLNHYLEKVLEPGFFKHCQVANVRNDILILIVDTPAWATRIRYMIPDLLQSFNQCKEFEYLKKIQCKLSPKNFEFNKNKLD